MMSLGFCIALLLQLAQGQSPAPADCKLWFDGCNNCFVSEKGLACTKMFCQEKASAFCREFNNGTKQEESK